MKVEVIKKNKDFIIGTVGELIKENKESYRVLIGGPCFSHQVTLFKRYSKKCRKTSQEKLIKKIVESLRK